MTFYRSAKHGGQKQIELAEQSDSLKRFYIIDTVRGSRNKGYEHRNLFSESIQPQANRNTLHSFESSKNTLPRLNIQLTSAMIEREALMYLNGGKQFPQNKKHVYKKSLQYGNSLRENE